MENTAKQEAIRKAYGEYWEQVKDSVNIIDGYCDNELFQDDDGDIIKCPSCSYLFHESKTEYCINSLERCPRCNVHVSQYEYHYKFINIPADSQKVFGKWRPKSLQGIETNNSWIRIESEEDLPNDYDQLFEVGLLDSEGNFTHERKRCSGKSVKWMWDKNLITHYQPIVKPEKPIY